MELSLGFIIAVAITLTGVGAGSLTTPLLILLLGLPPKECVGTALIFGAVVKLVAAPVYWLRGKVSVRALGYLLAGGLPGVLAGSFLLHGVRMNWVLPIVGFTIMLVALLNLFRFRAKVRHDRPKWLGFIALPIGAEVGFSSAGSGALGALALMSLTKLDAAEVVGTDLCFGLALSLVGGGIHAALGTLNLAVLIKLSIGGVAGAIVGSMLASRMPSRQLRFALSLVLVVLGAQLCWKGIAG
jgi:uncharacterized membrane protein YfcA